MTDHRAQLIAVYGGAVQPHGDTVKVVDPAGLASEATDRVVWQAVFEAAPARDAARWLLWELGQATGVRPSSIGAIYFARGRGECSGFTVPAINVRMLAYDTARAIFRAARKCHGGAILLEIARSEIAYTDQRPAEYVSVMIGAALREGWSLPVFIQGDHCQVNAKKYQSDPKGEVAEVKKLIAEEIGAGFYNIDVDTSTLVDLSRPTLLEQQRLNFEHAAEITHFIREREPEGVSVSVGAEIGEVGHKNSTVEELRAFMEGYNRELAKYGSPEGISKISVQTGTSHGGVVLADGTIAKVKLDLDALAALSKVAREEYSMSGAVQHGASTLPRSTSPPTSRVWCSTARPFRLSCGRRCTAGSTPTPRASGRRGIPRSSSTIRPARRRSVRSSGRSGRCRRTSGVRSRPSWRRHSISCSSSSR
jgi:fructose-bisphosphate aldolase class II